MNVGLHRSYWRMVHAKIVNHLQGHNVMVGRVLQTLATTDNNSHKMENALTVTLIPKLQKTENHA